jgi:hypothetical protein
VKTSVSKCKRLVRGMGIGWIMYFGEKG